MFDDHPDLGLGHHVDWGDEGVQDDDQDDVHQEDVKGGQLEPVHPEH